VNIKNQIRIKIGLLCLLSSTALYSAQLLYRATFENGFTSEGLSITKEITTPDGATGGAIDVVDNPKKDSINTSNKVARCSAPNGYRRAEIASGRSITDETVRTYKWSYFFPDSFFNNGGYNWAIFSQFKTWPCGYHDGHSATICASCGIFNDVSFETAGNFNFRFRAMPDCHNFTSPVPVNEWVNFVLQIYWTQTSTGWAKLYRNGGLVYSQTNFRTLFTSFIPTTCNLYWGVGIYCDNKGTAASMYVDNLEMYDSIVNPGASGILPRDFRSNTNHASPLLSINTHNDIVCTLTEPTRLIIRICNLAGTEVAPLTKENLNAGSHIITRIPSDFPEGIYMLWVSGNNSEVAKKVLIHGSK
jgi:hypothetical protein